MLKQDTENQSIFSFGDDVEAPDEKEVVPGRDEQRDETEKFVERIRVREEGNWKVK